MLGVIFYNFNVINFIICKFNFLVIYCFSIEKLNYVNCLYVYVVLFLVGYFEIIFIFGEKIMKECSKIYLKLKLSLL